MVPESWKTTDSIDAMVISIANYTVECVNEDRYQLEVIL